MRKLLLLSLAAASSMPTSAATATSIFGVTFTGGQGAQALGVPMQILLLMTVLTVLPAVLMSLTPFLRSIVVLHFLRQALGTQTTPSNQVLVGLALFLALVVIAPVAEQVYHDSWEPFESGVITGQQAWDRAQAPIHAFLLKFAREKDIRLFLEISHSPAPGTPAEVPLSALAPAYVLSELKASFQIGAVLF